MIQPTYLLRDGFVIIRSKMLAYYRVRSAFKTNNDYFAEGRMGLVGMAALNAAYARVVGCKQLIAKTQA